MADCLPFDRSCLITLVNVSFVGQKIFNPKEPLPLSVIQKVVVFDFILKYLSTFSSSSFRFWDCILMCLIYYELILIKSIETAFKVF